MKFIGPKAALIAAALALAPTSSAFAQRPAPTPEQRIERLERQLQQMQRQVFPKGRPADTAGFADDPAATQSSVISLDQRLASLERQMSELLRQSEDSSNRMSSIEREFGAYRTTQNQRLSAVEQQLAAGPATASPVPTGEATPSNSPAATAQPKPKPAAVGLISTAPDATASTDLGEEAYTEGFRIWEAGNYDAAITALRAFTAAYPKHRRVSFANNLIGRALLDKGQASAAAQVLLANYRKNPQGERAADSLYYLGQALVKLNQPGQACKAYAELDAVYGSKVRPDLRKLVDEGKAQAQCS